MAPGDHAEKTRLKAVFPLRASVPLPPGDEGAAQEMRPLVDSRSFIRGRRTRAAGVDNMILVITGRARTPSRDHFDFSSVELETFLESRGKAISSQRSARISNLLNVCYVRPRESRSVSAIAVLVTRSLVGANPSPSSWPTT